MQSRPLDWGAPAPRESPLSVSCREMEMTRWLRRSCEIYMGVAINGAIRKIDGFMIENPSINSYKWISGGSPWLRKPPDLLDLLKVTTRGHVHGFGMNGGLFLGQILSMECIHMYDTQYLCIYIYINSYIIYIYILYLHIHVWLYDCMICVYIYTYNHHPFEATFQRGTIPKCKIHFLGPPLNVKWVAERPQGVGFVGRVLKIPSKCKLACSRSPRKHLEKWWKM